MYVTGCKSPTECLENSFCLKKNMQLIVEYVLIRVLFVFLRRLYDAVSTSTRNFPNRLGKGANVYLASAELASVAAIIGRLPTPDEYLQYASKLDATSADTYRYLNFDQLPEYMKAAEKVEMDEDAYANLGPAMKAQLMQLAEEKKAAKAKA